MIEGVTIELLSVIWEGELIEGVIVEEVAVGGVREIVEDVAVGVKASVCV